MFFSSLSLSSSLSSCRYCHRHRRHTTTTTTFFFIISSSSPSSVVAATPALSLPYFSSVSGGARPGPAGARAPAEKGCAPADEVRQNLSS